MYVTVYTDGSYRNGVYAWAYSFEYNGKVHEASGRGTDPEAAAMRNIAGELAAVMQALTTTRKHGVTNIRLIHDYQGIGCWMRGEWKAKNPLVKQFIAYIDGLGLNVEYVWKRGHSGDPGNSRVDKLAYAALG